MPAFYISTILWEIPQYPCPRRHKDIFKKHRARSMKHLQRRDTRRVHIAGPLK